MKNFATVRFITMHILVALFALLLPSAVSAVGNCTVYGGATIGGFLQCVRAIGATDDPIAIANSCKPIGFIQTSK